MKSKAAQTILKYEDVNIKNKIYGINIKTKVISLKH
jgi:hypothetical protein